MNFKLFFRTFLFLLILFAMLYIGMTNTDNIQFQLPLILDKPVKQPAAIIYFAIFAIGVVGGTLFNLGGGKGGRGASKAKD